MGEELEFFEMLRFKFFWFNFCLIIVVVMLFIVIFFLEFYIFVVGLIFVLVINYLDCKM